MKSQYNKKESVKMTEKMQQAIDKIDKEAEANQSLKPFAQYVTDKLIASDEAAEKILDDRKTLKGCFSDSQSKVRQMASGGCACVDDETVFAWIRGYFGFDSEPVSAQTESNIIDFDIFADL